MYWIYLSQNRKQCWAVIDTVIIFSFKDREFLFLLTISTSQEYRSCKQSIFVTYNFNFKASHDGMTKYITRRESGIYQSGQRQTSGWKAVFRFPLWTRQFSLILTALVGSGAQPASNIGPSEGVKAWLEADHSPLSFIAFL
jgi:hypothetical protein